MTIKEKTLALASEHNIELFVEGWELSDGTTGWGGEWDHNLSNYQCWKLIYADVLDLVERKSEWREIVKVGA
ncbi:MAG: hypothetical protein EBU08_17715 [Micrococcales bacterium]|nr:hypothetical protein [Micrococcales bacterium]